MSLLTAVVIILSVILIPGMAVAAEQIDENTNIVLNGDVQSQSPTSYSKPDLIPSLKPYIIDKSTDIWHAEDPGSYITPDNDWVKFYASQLYIDYDGRIRYKNRPIPLFVDIKGNVLSWTDEPFVNNYVTLKDYFGYELPNNDYWMMPDYYLYNGQRGICSGWSLAVTSMILSGEMSVKENGQFIKQVIPAKAVLGYINGNRDGWSEYQVYGKTFMTTTSLLNTGIDGTEKLTSTEFVEKKDKTTAKPVFEFTDKNFGNYKAW
ncbi:MAG: hypothetical protein O8C62_10110 [Candidatus Methanoperedens sp.]|nr:hypothetical protein [Candidatus Methanoperedens sp.]